MTEADDIRARLDALQEKLRAVHGIRGRDLSHALRRARTKLPRHVRKLAAPLAQAEPMLGNPGLERTLDFTALKKAHDAIDAHLDSVNVADIRKGRLLAMAGLVSFYVIFVAVCFVLWMVWAEQI
jgi:hypothetical protein